MTLDPAARRRRHIVRVVVILAGVAVFLLTRGLNPVLTLGTVGLLAVGGWLSVRNTRFCPTCGHVVPFGPYTPTVARFCPKCGTPLNPPPDPGF